MATTGGQTGAGGLSQADWDTVELLLEDTGYALDQLGDPEAWAMGEPGSQSFPDDLIRGGFNCSQLITDDEFTDALAMTEGDVRAFLEQHDTVLNQPQLPVWEFDVAGNKVLTDRTVDIAHHVVVCAQALQINPKVLLTILQKEESLVTGWAPPAAGEPAEKIGADWKMVMLGAGFGVFDREQNAAYRYTGIDRQIVLAAFLSRRLFDSLDPDLPTPEEYPATFSAAEEEVQVNNRATWVLYRYTPHTIDEDGQGNGFPQIWQALFGATGTAPIVRGAAARPPGRALPVPPPAGDGQPPALTRRDLDLPRLPCHGSVADLRQQYGAPEQSLFVNGTGEFLLFYRSKGFVADTVRDTGRVIGWYLTPGSGLQTGRGVQVGASRADVIAAYGLPPGPGAPGQRQLLYVCPTDRNLRLRFTLGADGQVRRISAGSGFTI